MVAGAMGALLPIICIPGNIMTPALRCMAGLLACACISLAAARPAETLPRLDQSGRWLVDDTGRVVLIHGGNLMMPEDEAQSPKGLAQRQETPRHLAEQGFNGVRLVLFFSRLMPRPGEIDTAYLAALQRAVDRYRQAGVHVLLDFHQDEYGPSVGIRGLPDWMVFNEGRIPMGLPFPAGYFSDPAIQVAFDNFWKNHPVPGTGKGVQDFYMDGLQTVAERFKDDPAVFGIDVMNEPFPGSRCNQPNPLSSHCPALEQELLAPFYRRAGAAIAAVAPRLIVFVEPFMLQGALGVPIDTPSPGERIKRGLSFHQYGTLAEIRQRGNAHVMASIRKTGSVVLNTEWGFTNDPVEWTTQAGELDGLLIPWLAWARGPFGPLVDAGLPPLGNDNREATLRALARPYPRATAGTPLHLDFDSARGELRYVYSTTRPDGKIQRDGITEIVLPPANFPSGYRVRLDAGQARVVSPPHARVLRVKASIPAREVRVQVQRLGDLPALPALVPTANPYGFLAQGKKPAGAGGLSSQSILGDLLNDPRARAILDREVPDLVRSPQIGMGSQMTLRTLQPFVPKMLTNEILDRIDQALKQK